MISDKTVFEQALRQALITIRRTIPAMGTSRPSIGLEDYRYQRGSEDDWVASFWCGQLWLAYAYTREQQFLDAALAQQPYFEWLVSQTQYHDHDLGFLFSLSTVAHYKLTGDTSARATSLQAAASLSQRYNPAGHYIRAWNAWSPEITNEGRIIIDCMENLALLYWASEENGDARAAEIATAHADTTLQHIVRPDSSTFHVFDFDPETGSPIAGGTHQGYADDSCWSRGQAWAIHGYSQTYAYTKADRFLQAATRLADYAIAHLPEDGVPVWDYMLPESEHPYRDTSAGAVTAAGIFLLADQLRDTTQAAKYRAAAHKILTCLIEGYTTADIPHAEGLLKEGAGHVKVGRKNNMLPYGDYYYLEALLRALGHTTFFW